MSSFTLVLALMGVYICYMKHQAKRYRTINGIKMFNYCDLIMCDVENKATIKEAREKYQYVRKIKHPEGFYQLFVSNIFQETTVP